MRSKELWKYLVETGALNGSEEEIAKAKLEYRKIYKAEWIKRQHIPQKQLRPSFSLKEYQNIKLKAHEIGLHPSKFVKYIVIASLDSMMLIPNKAKLQKILQLLSMIAIAIENNKFDISIIKQQLLEAEKLLLQYLKHDRQDSFPT